jgi:pimeloyl-ACP methyl ester carboxylesterase
VAAHAVADGLAVERLVLVTPIAGSALAGPRRALTRATVLVHRLAAALPEPLGAGVLRSRAFTRIASVAMVKTRDREPAALDPRRARPLFGGFADRRTLLEAYTASVSGGVDAAAPRITVPTLVIAAALDDITPPAEQRRLVGLFPDARLAELDGTGHLVHYERPDAVGALVEEFVA